jgi:hypothetical protein
MSAKGFLLAMMEPPAGFEEEFHAWYDTEHVPERMVVQGFETGQRFECVSGFPRYVAMYDLTTLAVLASPEYQKAAGDKVSPWTHRVRTKVMGRYRFTGTQVYPGSANLGDQGGVVRLLLLRFRNVAAGDEEAILGGLRKNFEGRGDVMQVRMFRGEEANDCLGCIEFRSASPNTEIAPGTFGSVAAKLDLMNVYVPYWRGAIHKK